MQILYCPSLDFPFPGGSWPPNLSLLEIGELKKPVSEWGMQKFPTSLVTLRLFGEDSDGLVSFAAAKGEEEEDGISSFILPSSLTELCIWGFKELESVSEGMQHLTCLQHLYIMFCPKVRDLPETLLPSLSTLTLWECSSEELKEKCSESRKGKYWPLISQIPTLDIRWVHKHKWNSSLFGAENKSTSRLLGGFILLKALNVIWEVIAVSLVNIKANGAVENLLERSSHMQLLYGSVVELDNRAKNSYLK
ncbi:hypothetical protein M8C21_014252 [Ambrosia artemisiifolia]|uniref:Uncharacterized protein n=1 Tax=Ambrosia artemisiifolia TaxID=4212 RepID=A0AAD5GN57_AMBAR|nr:hypothetical protein M8C21_014252 [Ambrosia artemisiifolia]